MKLIQALNILSKLPVTASQAVDIQTLCERMPEVPLRTMQGYMRAFIEGDAQYRNQRLVRRVGSSGMARGFRYYRDNEVLRQWFMTDHIALNLMLAGQVLGASLGRAQRLDSAGLAAQADQLLRQLDPQTRRLAAHVRIVPDGVGRRPIPVSEEVSDKLLEAIALGRLCAFTYVSASGNERRWEVSPRGLVAKDGAIYLLATRDMGDWLGTFTLHRMRDCEVLTRHSPPSDFDLDRYLEETQNLSHPLTPQPLVDLKLRVRPGTLYHFTERPLWNQTLSEPDETGHVLLTARVTNGIMLVPFLQSMSPGVEVLEPPEVREEVARRILESAEYYAKDKRTKKAA